MRKVFALGSSVLFLAACSGPAPAPEAQAPVDEVAPQIAEVMEKHSQGDMEANEGDVMMEGEAMMKPAKYTAYADDVLMDGETKLLFFHASWCPACKKANTDLEAIYGGSTAPMKSTYKVDYDTSAELKAKYGVTSQHTFVLVDGQGNELKKMNGHTVEGLKELLM